MKLFLLLFLSLTPAIAKYTKRGCSDKCGNVRIPYPFGIGAECSVNEWYTIDCKNSSPYLSKLKHLKVLGVSLKNQTVTVSMPRIFDCYNPVRNSILSTSYFDLDGSPFLFSKSHNKFVFQGCGSAAMMNNGSVVTGCSSACLKNITVGDRNSCFGIGCCQIAIPHYVKSYNISLMGGLEVHGGCGSAFLVEDESLYEQGRFSDTFKFKNSSFIPVSLLWTLTDSDHVTCCFDESPFRRKVNVFNGNSLDTLKCSYYTRLSLKDNPYLTDGCEDYEKETAKYAKTGCKEMCGNVTIPFPFGIGTSCSVNRWYIVDCKNSTPYLRALNNLKVLSVDLENHTIIVSTPRITDCQNPIRNSSEIMGVNLGLSPFLFSKTHNKFVFEGCGVASMMDNGNVLTACTTTCHGVTLNDRNNCFGIGCCQTAIPHYLKSYTISLTGLDEESGGSCGSAFLVDETSYEEGNFSVRNTSFIPVSLMWTLRDSDQVTCCDDRTLIISQVDILNDTVYTWNCSYSYSYSYSYYSIRGNPYLADGCMYTYDPTDECKRCQDRGGYCMRNVILDVDGLVFSQNYTCYGDNRTSLGVILGVSISMGVLFIIAISYLLYKVIKKNKRKEAKKEIF